MPAQDHRLTTAEMARFVTEGFLRFEALVPETLNERILAELAELERVKLQQAVGVPPEGGPERPASGTPLSGCYAEGSALRSLLSMPEVLGIVESLVGREPVYDHDFVHHLPAGSQWRQHLHVDAVLDTDDPSFDVQLFYFPRAVAAGEGGTRFVPGSHLRRVRAEGIARYQRVLGERQYEGPAGTLLVFHHGLWHAGQPNPSPRDRWMYKVRLNAAQPQVRLWNDADFDAFHNDAADHVFATMRFDSAAHAFRAMQPWQQGHEARLELMERARLWRYLTGDARFDADYYFTRLEGRARSEAGSTPS